MNRKPTGDGDAERSDEDVVIALSVGVQQER
jgi:hypothetical protein